MERLALLFSDGTISVYQDGASIDELRRDRDGDVNELPERRAKIVKLQISDIEIVEELKPVTPVKGNCPTCGQHVR